MRFVSMGNLAGIPSLVLPVGYGSVGKEDGNDDMMPIGMQLMGRQWNEHVLLRIGHVIENHLVERRMPPECNRFEYKL